MEKVCSNVHAESTYLKDGFRRLFLRRLCPLRDQDGQNYERYPLQSDPHRGVYALTNARIAGCYAGTATNDGRRSPHDVTLQEILFISTDLQRQTNFCLSYHLTSICDVSLLYRPHLLSKHYQNFSFTLYSSSRINPWGFGVLGFWGF